MNIFILICSIKTHHKQHNLQCSFSKCPHYHLMMNHLNLQCVRSHTVNTLMSLKHRMSVRARVSAYVCVGGTSGVGVLCLHHCGKNLVVTQLEARHSQIFFLLNTCTSFSSCTHVHILLSGFA